MANSSGIPPVPIFSGTGYELWSSKMQNYFITMDLWDLIEDGYNPENLTVNRLKEVKKRDAKAIYCIQQALSEEIATRLGKISSAKEAWRMLEHRYHGSSRIQEIKLQTLHRKFESAFMEEDEDLNEFVTSVVDLVNQIRGFGDVIEEVRVVKKILRSLPQKFDHVVTAIEEGRDVKRMTSEELLSSLLPHAERMSRFEKNKEEGVAFFMRSEKKQNEKFNKSGDVSKRHEFARSTRDRKTEGNGETSKKKFQCYYSSKVGHIERKC